MHYMDTRKFRAITDMYTKTLRNALLWHFHDLPISGHQGVSKTTKRVDLSSYFRSNFHREISDYVKSCNICEGKKNPSKKKRHFVKSYVSGRRFEKIAADLARPFPTSENKNIYNLVVADYFLTTQRFIHYITLTLKQ